MARINTYAIDDNVTSQDKWIGTDAAGNITKNFTPENVANWINKTNAVGIAGQTNFRFQNVITPERLSGTISFELGSGDGTQFSAINNIIVSKYGSDGNLILDYLEALVGTYILICQVDDTNNFGVYQFGSLTQLEDEPNFYNAVLTVQSSNGALSANEYYGVVAFPASSIVSVTGLEAIDEGNGNGWRLIGRDPDNYGNIGEGAIDFSDSNEATNENGSVGDGAITFGTNNINESGRSIVTGSGVNLRKTNEFSASNIVTGESPLNIWGVTYNSIIAAWRSEVNVEGTSYDTNVVYQSLVVGDGLNFYSGRDSGVVGGGLISGSTGCFTVGVGNEDLTTTTSTYITNYYNNYGPRFIVGCGVYQPGGAVTTRQNGFVVMSDGTATFPILTNAKIDAAGDDSAVTKAWINANTAGGTGTTNYLSKWSAADTLTDSVIYDNGTNVGIGTTSPAEKLDVVGNLYLRGTNNLTISSTSVGGNFNLSSGIRGFNFANNNGDLLHIDSTGNVGIGTTSPSVKLHVNSGDVETIAYFRSADNRGRISIADNDTTNYVISEGSKMSLGSNASLGAGNLTIDSSGNVGIGTTSPGASLHIAADNPIIRLQDNTSSDNHYLTGNNGEFRIQTTGFLTLRPGNAESVRFLANGNVGIGTTSPSEKLQVISSDNIGTTKIISAYSLSESQSTSLGYNSLMGSYSLDVKTLTTQPITLSPNSSEAMRITSTGNVGIGTTSPGVKLHVKGGASGYLFRVQGTSALNVYDPGTAAEIGIGSSSGDKLKLFSNDALNNGITIDTTGNVGIGTTSPSAKLDISGNIRTSAGGAWATSNGGVQLTYDGTTGYLTTYYDSNSLVLGAGVSQKTGIYINGQSAATNDIKFKVGNSTSVTFDSTGNVGIGTTSPGAKLEVVGDALANNYWSPSGSNAYYMNYNSTAGMYIDSTRFITLNAGGNEGIRIESTFGNVGIANTNPTEKLDINGNVKLGTTTGKQLMFGENKYGAVRLGNNLIVGGNSAVDIRTGNAAISSQSSRVFINQVGFVGVGTTSPIALLDVNGPIKIGDAAVTSPLANTAGTMRYRADSNNSYLEMVMQTGASTYAWVVIKQNTW